MSFYPIFITAFIFIFKKSNAFLDAAACDIGTPCLGGYECLNGNCLTLCGGIAGFSCQEGYACVDDPTDDCDPSNGGADCAGICVVEPPLLCVDDSECVSNMWCRDIQDSNGGCGNNKECVPYAIEGESCEAFTLPCYFEKCSPDMTCFHSNPMLPDLPGTCQSDSGSTAYNLVNVGSAFTEMEANDYCISNYGTTLATINTQNDYNTARTIIDNSNPTEQPLIGLINNRKKGAAFFKWNSGDKCPIPGAAYGACVPAEFWVDKKPIECQDKGGSNCVTFYNNGFNNDRDCGNRLTFLCNGDLYPTVPGRIDLAHNIGENSVSLDVGNKNGFNFVEYISNHWIYAILGLSAILNAIYFIYCCYGKWCRNKTKKGNKTYDKVIADDEAELIGGV